jgi:hypothetical protein
LSKGLKSATDPGIETLSTVLNPAAFTAHLRGASLSGWNEGVVQEAHVVSVLKHHLGQRCTLEIDLQTETGSHSVIGKIYGNDRLDILETMQRIQKAGFGPRYEYSIPAPIAYLPPLRLLLQERVEGCSAKEVFKTGDDRSRVAAAERCALWLARFQAMGPTTGPAFDTSEYISSLRGRTRRITSLGGPCAEKAARLLESLERAGAALRPAGMRAGHASYSPAQIILAEGRTVVFDWDDFDVADPARDAARFIVALRRLAMGKLGSIRALDGPAQVFLKTYQSAGHLGAEENLLFFQAAACHTLAVYLTSHQVPRWIEKLEAMLDEGLRIFEMELAR